MCKERKEIGIKCDSLEVLCFKRSIFLSLLSVIKQQNVWCHTFDLSRKIKSSDLEQCNITTFDLTLSETNSNDSKPSTTKINDTKDSSPLEKKCKALYNALNHVINAHNRSSSHKQIWISFFHFKCIHYRNFLSFISYSSIGSEGQANVLRIGIQSFGSPLWGTHSTSTEVNMNTTSTPKTTVDYF